MTALCISHVHRPICHRSPSSNLRTGLGGEIWPPAPRSTCYWRDVRPPPQKPPDAPFPWPAGSQRGPGWPASLGGLGQRTLRAIGDLVHRYAQSLEWMNEWMNDILTNACEPSSMAHGLILDPWSQIVNGPLETIPALGPRPPGGWEEKAPFLPKVMR